jgi:hypothetical protein
MSHYRPSKRPKVGQVQNWDTVFEQRLEYTWCSNQPISVKVECGYPFPHFYRVTVIRGESNKKSKLFYGEIAYKEVEMYVYDLGFRSVLGRI